jgi:hypothetical protein
VNALQREEKRICSRTVCNTTFEFRSNSGPSQKTYIGAAVNISDSGMCVYAFDCFKEGETIEMVKNILVPYRKATVRWVKECYEDFYKIGIAFIK